MMRWWKIKVDDFVVVETQNRNDANEAFFALVRCQSRGTICLVTEGATIARSDA